MGKKLLVFGASAVVLLAYLYQVFLHDVIFVTFGVGREHARIESFPFNCRRIYHPLLEGCEDMVLDPIGRRLYAACSTVSSRAHWSPGGDKFNASGRGLTDHISVLAIDTPDPENLYKLHTLTITGPYSSSSGDQTIDLHGLSIEILSPTRLRFWLINHRPPISPSGMPLDSLKIGANSTIEVFEHTPGTSILEYIKTISSPSVHTPNNLVAVPGGVLVTNDHKSATPSLFRPLEKLTGHGSISFCSLTTSKCHIASPPSFRFNFANGITAHPTPNSSNTTTVYVANASSGKISIFSFSGRDGDEMLEEMDEIAVGMPIDNLSLDTEGAVFAAGFPDVLGLVRSLEEKGLDVGSSVFRIGKEVGEGEEGGYRVSKVLEDVEGKTLPASTVAVHDVVSGSFWMGGVSSGFIAVCERKK